MEEKDKIDILADNLLNEKIQGEEEKLQQWKEDHEDNRKVYEILNHVHIPAAVLEYAANVRESIRIQLNQKINRSMMRIRILKITTVAAIVVLLIGIFSMLSYKAGYEKKNTQLVKVENPLGIKSSVTLPDGTHVTLNAGSTLIYPTAFVDKQRKISLQGEAFFEVVHDAKHPFIVNAENIFVQVLGTKFNLKAYSDENNIEVTLAEGSVSVGLIGDSQTINMKPMEQVTFDKKSLTFSKNIVYLNENIAWKDGKLYFNSLTFAAIAKQLERKYNVHIFINSEKLKNEQFTGDFVRDENLDQILKIMTQDQRINYRRNGDKIYISEKNKEQLK